MDNGDRSRRIVRFGVFEADFETGELRKNGAKIPLQGQPFQVCAILLERSGELVTREELRQKVWPEDTFVDFDHAVNTAIKKIRIALGDEADNPRFVQTLPRRGYRFIGPVDKPSSQAVPPVASKGWFQRFPARRKWLIASTTLLILLSGIGIWRSSKNRANALPPIKVAPLAGFSQRRLTANPDDIPLMGGVISPDGRYLAYTDAGGFYLRQVDSGETRLVTFAKGFEPLPESWFPDSVHLLVTWIEPHKGPPSLWRISVLGGTPLKIAEEASSARVSPDGSQIASLKGKWDCEQIWIMQADGSGARKLIDGGNDAFGAVAWAPDSRRFAYFRAPDPPGSDQKGNRVEIYDLPSGRSEVILPEPRIGGAIAWLNSGRLIYTLGEAEPNQGDSNPWWVQLDARTGRPSSPPVRIGRDHGDVAEISVTTDGKRMALLRSSYQSDVYLAELQDQGKRLSAPRRFTLDDRSDFPSAWTADSQTVLFASDRDGRYHIFKQPVNEKPA